jgi:GT2 family glycosyltransferase
VHDLAVIVVSTNQAHWLRRCLPTVLAQAGPIDLDVVVVDNGHEDGAAELVEREFPAVRALRCPNRGFAHANNQALGTVDARHVLLLNPDTEILEGTLADLVALIDRRPEVGVIGVKQLADDGTLYPSMRNFPSVGRVLGDALGLERMPGRPAWLGERDIEPRRYAGEHEGDWTIGSFMLIRREVLESVGWLDERFFIYSEEVDFCLRVGRAGWTTLYTPAVTILHHVQNGSLARAGDSRIVRQNAYAQLQYADKNFSAPYGAAFRGALLLRYGLRSVAPGDPKQRAAARAAAAVVLGRSEAPFGTAPADAAGQPEGDAA